MHRKNEGTPGVGFEERYTRQQGAAQRERRRDFMGYLSLPCRDLSLCKNLHWDRVVRMLDETRFAISIALDRDSQQGMTKLRCGDSRRPGSIRCASRDLSRKYEVLRAVLVAKPEILFTGAEWPKEMS